MTLLGLGTISLLLLLLVFMNNAFTKCENTSENINVLDSVVEYTSSNLPQEVYSLYETEINELANWGSNAYSVYLFNADLNCDGRDEIISFFMSTINSGSSGNFKLDIWEGESTYKNVGPRHTFCLNPKDGATRSELIFYMDKQVGNYPTLEYCTLKDDGVIIEQKLFKLNPDSGSFDILTEEMCTSRGNS